MIPAMKNNFVFIIGGARSGKSAYASELAKKYGGKTAFIATARPSDDEMAERIRLHKSSRPKQWKVYEEYSSLSGCFLKIKKKFDTVIIDCISIFVSNLMCSDKKDIEIKKEISSLTRLIKKRRFNVIMVSNEVGSGIVPVNSLARRFRDLLGAVNQMLARSATRVIAMHAGIPVEIKNEK